MRTCLNARPDSLCGVCSFMKVSILGCGRIGTRHAVMSSPWYPYWRGDLDKRWSGCGRFGAKMYSNLEDMLADQKGKTDLVSVCSNGFYCNTHSLSGFVM